jgi:hypothetical protein
MYIATLLTFSSNNMADILSYRIFKDAAATA